MILRSVVDCAWWRYENLSQRRTATWRCTDWESWLSQILLRLNRTLNLAAVCCMCQAWTDTLGSIHVRSVSTPYFQRENPEKAKKKTRSTIRSALHNAFERCHLHPSSRKAKGDGEPNVKDCMLVNSFLQVGIGRDLVIQRTKRMGSTTAQRMQGMVEGSGHELGEV